MEQFYVYAHVFHTATSSFCVQRLGLSTSICSGCLKGLPILSNLATNKLLELAPDQMCHISEEDQHNSQHALLQSQIVHEPKEKLTDLAADNLEQTVSNKDKNSEKMHRLGLSIMTYNIWNFFTYEYSGRYHQRISRISEVNCDVVLISITQRLVLKFLRNYFFFQLPMLCWIKFNQQLNDKHQSNNETLLADFLFIFFFFKFHLFSLTFELAPDQMCHISEEEQHNSQHTLLQSQNVHEPKERLTDLAANNNNIINNFCLES